MMTKNLRSLIWILAVALALPALSQEADTTNLRPQWVAGQSAAYDFWGKTQKQETAELFGQQQSETTTYLNEGRITWRVETVNDDGSAVCTMQYQRVKFTVSAGEAESVTFDSDNLTGENPVLDALLSAMVGTPLTVQVEADGSIAAVEGLDALNAAAGQEAVDADVVPDELDFKQTASELATLIAAPAGATVGQTWNTTHTWNQEDILPGAETKAQWDTVFTFDQLGQIAGVPVATIKAESQVDIQIDLSALPEDAPDIDVQISDASATGEVLFDLSRGETVARNDTMSYTAAITVAPPNPEFPPITVQIVETSQSQILRVSEE